MAAGADSALAMAAAEQRFEKAAAEREKIDAQHRAWMDAIRADEAQLNPDRPRPAGRGRPAEAGVRGGGGREEARRGQSREMGVDHRRRRSARRPAEAEVAALLDRGAEELAALEFRDGEEI